MSFVYKTCPECSGQIVLGSDGSMWESFCVCEMNRQHEQQQFEKMQEEEQMREEEEKNRGK